MKNFINKAFFTNKYILIHFVGGFVYSMIHIPFCKNFLKDPKTLEMFLIVFCCAIVWELYEYVSEGKEQIKMIYGSIRNFLYDSAGDVVAALVGSLLLSIM